LPSKLKLGISVIPELGAGLDSSAVGMLTLALLEMGIAVTMETILLCRQRA
jgi:hypothetical protein